ncbi:hypothetical protein HID58_051999 [Brassica napus]|uniref:Uncharacterized protein n=1 Tax=Brassica napus TaxID=3708 RepID=A0ABQ8AC03_BRANA|nr:hypothetical protein HID58_051999 [Brassica napus]
MVISASNTIFIDDEPYKIILILSSHDLGYGWFDFDPVRSRRRIQKGELCSYLDDLANSSVVQAYIKEHSFGHPMTVLLIRTGLSTAQCEIIC